MKHHPRSITLSLQTSSENTMFYHSYMDVLIWYFTLDSDTYTRNSVCYLCHFKKIDIRGWISVDIRLVAAASVALVNTFRSRRAVSTTLKSSSSTSHSCTNQNKTNLISNVPKMGNLLQHDNEICYEVQNSAKTRHVTSVCVICTLWTNYKQLKQIN